jgi:uncharacterized protein YecE (DUF72 family)
LHQKCTTVANHAFIGTAGWNLPRAVHDDDAHASTRLERYARRLDGVEINSSFYRFHQARTYARWAQTTPPHFRFSLKVPRTLTHDARLAGPMDDLERLLSDSAALGAKRGPLLVQLPPSLSFDTAVVDRFFTGLRERHDGNVACEPRHPSWFSPDADRLLLFHHVARVAADPPRGPDNDRPGGWTGLAYFRWHGSPRTYWSRYGIDVLHVMAREVCEARCTAETWCIFDNTAAGYAFENAEELAALAGGARSTDPRGNQP